MVRPAGACALAPLRRIEGVSRTSRKTLGGGGFREDASLARALASLLVVPAEDMVEFDAVKLVFQFLNFYAVGLHPHVMAG